MKVETVKTGPLGYLGNTLGAGSREWVRVRRRENASSSSASHRERLTFKMTIRFGDQRLGMRVGSKAEDASYLWPQQAAAHA